MWAFPRTSVGELDDILWGDAQTKHPVLSESTKKTLQNILRKIVNENRTEWDKKLHSALWAYQMAYQTSIRKTPFRLAFGFEEVMLIEFQDLPSLRIQVRERLSEKESETIRLATLCEPEEHPPDSQYPAHGIGATAKESIRRSTPEG